MKVLTLHTVTTRNTLFVLVTEIVTPVNCTCVHFLLQPYKFMPYCNHTHKSLSFALLSIVHVHKEL